MTQCGKRFARSKFSYVQTQRLERKEGKRVVQKNSKVTSLWVVFGLSTLNFKKLVNQAFALPSRKESINIFPLKQQIWTFLLFFLLVLEHLEISERLLKQHRQKNTNAWRLFCSRQTCQNNASSINQLERNVHVVNVGRARTMDS